MNLIDLWKGEIEAMAFGDECDRFFEIFEVRDKSMHRVCSSVLHLIGVSYSNIYYGYNRLTNAFQFQRPCCNQSVRAAACSMNRYSN